MRFNRYFTLAEFTVSQTASRRGIRNEPSASEIMSIAALVGNVLLPIRLHFAKPIIISSGYRSQALNTAIGGSKTSQHTSGQAVDFTVSGYDDREVAEWIRDNLIFDQLILEYPPAGWIHVSYNAFKNRNETLTATRNKAGSTVYRKGI